MLSLSKEELSRYSRHLFLKQVGRGGQLRLKKARVLVVGSGGLGSPLLLYLAAAGVGHIALVDKDSLELSNLQRQVLFTSDEIGQSKAEAAAARLQSLNPEIEIQALPFAIEPENALGLIRGYDLVLEGSDNFPTKFLINDACVLLGIPFILGGILRFEGQVLRFVPSKGEKGGPCYRCIFEKPPPAHAVPSCSEAGVLGAIAGFVGSWMASEALKFLLELSMPEDTFVTMDLLGNPFRRLKIPRNPACAVCGDKPSIRSLRKENYLT